MPCLTGGACTEVATAYVWSDHLNTPRELTRVNGSNVHVSMWKWDSLPFGETSPNANPSNLGVMKFNHRFPGQYRDLETGLYQNWNREYDAFLGRYVTSDPKGLEAEPNTYAYAKGAPVTIKDATGLTGDVMQCNSPGGSIDLNDRSLIYFPHQFLCLPSGACYGYGPSGSVFGSLGAITEDSSYLKNATCKPVRHAPGCSSDQFETCIKGEIDKIANSPGSYSPAVKNCMEVSSRIIQTCASKCGFLGGGG